MLRPLQLSDLEPLHELWTDEPVRRLLWDGEKIPLARTREIIETSSRLSDERGFGIWSLRRHDDDRLVGFAGYWHFRDAPELELLFGVAADCWGRGFAPEAAREIIRYGFDTLGFDPIVASTDAANAASRRAIEKLGMRFDRRAVVDGLDTFFYSLKKEDWRAAGHDR